MDGFPAPGETFVSSAVERAIEADDSGRLSQRFGPVAGVVGNDALSHPDEWLIVRAMEATDLRVNVVRTFAPRTPSDVVGPIHGAAFGGGVAHEARVEQQKLANLGVLFLIVPLILMATAATRLGARARSRTLSVLRLLGATTRQCLGVVAIETAVTATIGSLIGVAVAHLVLPLFALIPAGDGTWFVTDLIPHPAMSAVVVLGLTAITLAGSVRSNLRALRDPRGTVESGGRQATRIVPRLAALVATIGATALIASNSAASPAAVVGVLATAFIAVSIAGPAVISIAASILSRWKNPVARLSAARLGHNASAAWRPVSGVALVGFLAGLISLFPLEIGPSPYSQPGTIESVLPAEIGSDIDSRLSAALDEANIANTVEQLSGTWFGVVVGGPDQIVVRVIAPDNSEEARVVVEEVTGWPALIAGDEYHQMVTTLGFIRAGVFVLLGSVVMVALLTAIMGAVADLIDSTSTIGHLWLGGTPTDLLVRIQRWQVLFPFGLGLSTAVIAGVLCGIPLSLLGGTRPSAEGFALLATCVLTTAAIATLAARITSPVLRSQLATLYHFNKPNQSSSPNDLVRN